MISEVSKRYSRALFELAQESGQSDQILAELRALGEAVGTSHFGQFLSSPSIALEDKVAAVKATLSGKVTEITLNTVLLILENGRAELLHEILTGYEEFSDAAHGVTRGTVRSADALSSERQKALEQAIFAATKRKVIFTYSNDSSLVGGMVAQVGGWTFDDSLKSHLNRMGEELKQN